DIDGEHLIGERRMQVHRTADYQWRSLVATKNAGGKRPGHLHLAHVLGVDLRQLAVTLVVHITRLHRPVLGIGSQLLDIRIRRYDARTRYQPSRGPCPGEPWLLDILHSASYVHSSC